MKGSSIHIYDYSTNVTKMQDKNWFYSNSYDENQNSQNKQSSKNQNKNQSKNQNRDQSENKEQNKNC